MQMSPRVPFTSRISRVLIKILYEFDSTKVSNMTVEAFSVLAEHVVLSSQKKTKIERCP